MSLNTSKTLFGLILSIIAQYSHATQYVEKSHESIVEVNISSAEQNALVIEGGRIDTVIPSVADSLSYVKDTKNGVLYFALANRYHSGTISVFVTDEAGNRYRIILVPQQIAAEEIVIRPPRTAVAQENQSSKNKIESGHTSKIKNMIYLMATHDGSEIGGVTVTNHNKEIALWKESSLILLDSFMGDGVRGERYEITNISNAEMVIQEQEFFRKSVIGVSIENMNIAPMESSKVYIVRQVD